MSNDDKLKVRQTESKKNAYKELTIIGDTIFWIDFVGEGQIENSYKTPLGNHIIKEKIGTDAPKNIIFKERINTGKLAEIYHDDYDSEDDHVTSRILWLEGTEKGFNKGGNVDSFYRYIYIHGTPEEGLIGEKASHGCIRMFNQDVIELYSLVEKGTKVSIVL